jgi:hypothetical protein
LFLRERFTLLDFVISSKRKKSLDHGTNLAIQPLNRLGPRILHNPVGAFG